LIIKMSKYGMPFYEGKLLSKHCHIIDQKGIRRIVVAEASLNETLSLTVDKSIVEEIQNTVVRRRLKICN